MNHEEIIAKVNAALDEKNLNFEAKMAETFAMVDGVYVPTGKFTPVRTDKQGKDAVIGGGNFSRHYTPIQNVGAFYCLGEMAEVADIEFVNVGSWGNGAGVFAQISLGEMDAIGSSGDRVGKYLSLVNSHDGSRSLQLLVTPFRFFCSNQISKAIGDAAKNNRIISIYHNAHGADRLRELAEAMHTAQGVLESSEVAYKRLGIAKSGTAPFMLELYIYGNAAKTNRNLTIEIDLTDEEYAQHKPIVENFVKMFAGCMKKLEADLKAEANRRREATRYAFCEKANLLNDPSPEDAPKKPSWGLSEAMKAARDLDGLVFPESHLGQELKMLPG